MWAKILSCTVLRRIQLSFTCYIQNPKRTRNTASKLQSTLLVSSLRTTITDTDFASRQVQHLAAKFKNFHYYLKVRVAWNREFQVLPDTLCPLFLSVINPDHIRYNGSKTVTTFFLKYWSLQPYAEFNCLSRAIFKIQNGQIHVKI